MEDKLFTRKQIVCTKTLYRYIDLGLLGIKNIDLPEKLRRSPKKTQVHKNKRILGRSIEERPAYVNDRKEFGHWEAVLVIGSKNNNDDALLTMIERKTREYWMIRIPGRDPNSVMNALSTIYSQFEEHWATVLRMISSRMNWIGFIPVSPDRLFNCQCSTCYCNLRQFSILITASYIILIISGSIINIYA